MSKTQKDEIKDLNTHKDDPFLHLSTVADALGRSPQTIGRWVAEGALPSIMQPNGMRKVRKSQLVAWLEVTKFGEDEGAMERVVELVYS